MNWITSATAALCILGIGHQARADTVFTSSEVLLRGYSESTFLSFASDGPIHLNAAIVERAVRSAPRAAVYRTDDTSPPTARLRQLIGMTEAGRHGYDAIVYSAWRLPADAPTNMTLAEIFQWIRNTPGQNHAIGRYQFIPATLDRLVRDAGLDHGTVFSAQIQDRLANILLHEAGYEEFKAGQMTRQRFMENLAAIWAGLPMSTGLSRYDGIAGNHAVISWEAFDAEMGRIFPDD